MEAFIYKHHYNYIKRCLKDLNNAFRGCVDGKIIETTKASIQGKIFNTNTVLSPEERSLLDITKITDPLHIDKYLADLEEYVFGMTKLTNAQLSRLFKKEKKLKLPPSNAQDSKLVYLGWIDNSVRKLFIAYNMDNNPIGMACRITTGSKNTHRCILCNHMGGENEVAFVSPICKTDSTNEGAYRSIGFEICLDSAQCNERITSTEKLEEVLRDVNNIKL